MDINAMYTVRNRSTSMVVYRIPEKGIRREFAPGETKKISYQELLDLSYQAGGRELMINFLQIQAPEVTKELNIHTEIEYNYSEADVKNLILNGSLDAFLDCLDFAPVGVIDLVKTFAVSLPMTDYDKRKALKDKTGFDVDKALANLEAEKAEELDNKLDPADTPSTGRRVKVESTPEAPARRTGGYKVINTGSTGTTE